MRRVLNILLLALLLCVVSVLHAQTRIDGAAGGAGASSTPHGFSSQMLGAGGSQYAHRSQRQIMQNNGLRTGQYSGEHYLFGFYSDCGYSAFTSVANGVSMAKGGGFGTFGFAFDYQNQIFLLHTGIGLRYQHVENRVADMSIMSYHVADSWTGTYDNEYCDVRYDFTNRVDYSQNLYAQIPFMMGAHVPYYAGAFYFLAGAKMQYAFAGNTYSKAIGNTMAQYDRYMGVWVEMDNHGFRKDVPMTDKNDRLKLKFDLLASVELGYELANPEHRGYKIRTVKDWRLRFGLFCDYGMLSIMPGTGYSLITIPEDKPFDFCEFKMNHPFATALAEPNWLRNLFVGVRFTALWGVKLPERCIMCFPYRDERNLYEWKRGGR